jgi:hypothetical protein
MTPAPVSWNVASVFWNGRTVKTSPIVTSPASMEARRPPPFWMAIWMPWSATRVEHGVGHEVAHRAFHRAADGAVALDEVGRLAHGLAHGLLDGAEQFGHAGGDALVRRHGGVEQHRVAVGVEHVALSRRR